jgi:hypothetical protein
VLLLVIVLWVFLRLDDVYIYSLDCTRVGKKKIEGGDSPSGRIDPSSRSLPPPPSSTIHTWMDRCNWLGVSFPFENFHCGRTGLVIIIIIIAIIRLSCLFTCNALGG